MRMTGAQGTLTGVERGDGKGKRMTGEQEKLGRVGRDEE